MADTETTSPPPAPPGDPRAGRGPRSLVLSLAALALPILVVAGVVRACAFSPGGPSVDNESVPTVDPVAALQRAANAVSFPVREPKLPTGWRANSADITGVAAGTKSPRAVRTGWLTGQGGYLRLSQSEATERQLVDFEVKPGVESNGAVETAGRRWTVYPAQRSERAWVTEFEGIRLLITGSGVEDEFRTMATATLAAPVIAKTR